MKVFFPESCRWMWGILVPRAWRAEPGRAGYCRAAGTLAGSRQRSSGHQDHRKNPQGGEKPERSPADGEAVNAPGAEEITSPWRSAGGAERRIFLAQGAESCSPLCDPQTCWHRAQGHILGWEPPPRCLPHPFLSPIPCEAAGVSTDHLLILRAVQATFSGWGEGCGPPIPLSLCPPLPAVAGGCCGRRARTGRDGAACAGAVTLPQTLKTQKRLFPFFFSAKENGNCADS